MSRGYNEHGLNILAECKAWCIDGTRKTSPKYRNNRKYKVVELHIFYLYIFI